MRSLLLLRKALGTVAEQTRVLTEAEKQARRMRVEAGFIADARRKCDQMRINNDHTVRDPDSQSQPRPKKPSQ